jgi:hypothetical protein
MAKEKTQVIVSVKVPLRLIADNLIAAFESSAGSHYWAADARYVGELPAAKGKVWYDQPHLLAQRCAIFKINYDDPKKQEGNLAKTATIYGGDLHKRLARMAEKSPVTFGHMIAEIGDALTADVMLQYIVLGEVIYG